MLSRFGLGLAVGRFINVSAAATITAPVLGFPTAANPPVVPVTVPQDAAVGDILTLQWSQSQTFASGVSSGTHALVSGETAGSTVTGFGIPVLSTGAPWYFRSTITHSGSVSPASNTVAWNDAVAATISTSATPTVAELSVFSLALAANKTISSWAITGGADRLQFAITGATLTWFANGSQDYDVPTSFDGTNNYVVQVTATDLAGNVTNKTLTTSVTAVSKQPTFTPAFTAVTGATDGTLYTSNTTTISGLASGLTVPATVTSFQFSKNGGAFQAAGSTTMTNGDTFALKGSTPIGSTSGVLTGSPGAHQGSNTFTVADAAVGLSTTNKNTRVTLSGAPLLGFSTDPFSSNAQLVGADTTKTGGIRQWEVTPDTPAGREFPLAFGLMVSGTSLTGDPSVKPGDGAGTPGFYVALDGGALNVRYNNTQVFLAFSGYPMANGDVYTVVKAVGGTADTGTINLYRQRAGVETLLATATGVADNIVVPFVGSDRTRGIGTVNFGGSAFTKALSGGAVGYQS